MRLPPGRPRRRKVFWAARRGALRSERFSCWNCSFGSAPAGGGKLTDKDTDGAFYSGVRNGRENSTELGDDNRDKVCETLEIVTLNRGNISQSVASK